MTFEKSHDRHQNQWKIAHKENCYFWWPYMSIGHCPNPHFLQFFAWSDRAWLKILNLRKTTNCQRKEYSDFFSSRQAVWNAKTTRSRGAIPLHFNLSSHLGLSPWKDTRKNKRRVAGSSKIWHLFDIVWESFPSIKIQKFEFRNIRPN